MKIAMIPARLGSQRLTQKNLRSLDGVSLITWAIRKCIQSGCFDQVWVNSENEVFREYAEKEGAYFHHRPEALGSDSATSEDFIEEFLEKHECSTLYQVHSIAPLLTIPDIQTFVHEMQSKDFDCLLSTELIQIECAYKGKPVNFNYTEKTNSQELEPIQKVSWSITAWKKENFLKAKASGQCATYSGQVGFHSISRLAAHVIKTAEDLAFAEAVFPLVKDEMSL